MATFKAHKGMDSMWISTSTDRKFKANAHSPADRSWPVDSDDWEGWRARHQDHTIAVWNGGNDQFWSLSRGSERAHVTPPNQGAPWWPQHPATGLDTLPVWAIDALIDLGEVTTTEIEEAKAVKTIAEGHMWMKPLGMAFDMCVMPIIERYSKEAAPWPRPNLPARSTSRSTSCCRRTSPHG
jgi:hypothetical protein